MAQFIKPYRVGDVVRLIDGDEHVISEVNVEGINDYEYATHLSAWHDHEELVFVRECDEQSMQKLIQSVIDEEGEEDDLDEDDSAENEEEDEG